MISICIQPNGMRENNNDEKFYRPKQTGQFLKKYFDTVRVL